MKSHQLKRFASALLVFMIVASSTNSSFSYTVDQATLFKEAAIEATDWITSFQVTPLTSSWGIPYPNYQVWGLDPFYYANGTITAGTNGIQGGAKRQLAFLIGGHDAGLGAYAALCAYLSTHNDDYLRIFRVYYDFFLRSQLPNNMSRTSAESTFIIQGKNVTINNSGYWPEQASVETASDKLFGSGDDKVDLEPVFPAAEHGNPIAAALIAYYRITGDESALEMLNRYGSWLITTQIHSGQFRGAFPVTQYYAAEGWKPRMYETTESAWILSELYALTRNNTYLEGAVGAGDYMLSRQFIGSTDSHVDGALPYESNKTEYSSSVSTNHAGFTLLAWTMLYRETGNSNFLQAAERYAKWLLSFQVTTPETIWGDHTFSNDSLAVGGYYYGYNTKKHEFQWRTALSLWSAAYAIPGLLMLEQASGDPHYLGSAELAAEWLTRMRFPDQLLIPLQSLAIIKYVSSSWWGKYPQFYQPNMSEVQKLGIQAFVDEGHKNITSIAEPQLTWYEQTFGVNFNLINYQMANRGPQFMKMIWSWWPSLGFEPRYGGDVAFGEFAWSNYLEYTERLENAQNALLQNERLANLQDIPHNFTDSILKARELLTEASDDFADGWYPIAVVKLQNAIDIMNSTTSTLDDFSHLIQIQQSQTFLLIVISLLLVGSNYYWHKRSEVRHVKTDRRRKRTKREN
jgi:hypothetical protein